MDAIAELTLLYKSEIISYFYQFLRLPEINDALQGLAPASFGGGGKRIFCGARNKFSHENMQKCVRRVQKNCHFRFKRGTFI